MAISSNPLPTSGVLGKLTDAEEQKLQQTWRALFDVVDSAPAKGTANGSAPLPADNPTPSSPAPKSDSERERVRTEQETAEARLALQMYGRDTCMKALWSLIAMDDPDSIILRFLRARKWNVNAAVAMITSCIKWRIERDVDTIIEKGEEGLADLDGFMGQLKDGKCFTQGFDRQGRPVVYTNIALHRSSAQSQEALEKFIILVMETVRCLLVPPADKVSIVFNMKGFSMKNMDWNALTFLVKCLEAYYPESLNCLMVHDAPWIVNGIWKMVQPLLDPVVRAKVQFTRNAADLCIHIPDTHVAPSLGGKNTWTWEYAPPVPGENKHQNDPLREQLQERRAKLIAEYEQVSREWTEESLSKSSELYQTRRCLAKALRTNYFWLDHYRRAKTIYHRNGNVVGNGLVIFEHPTLDGRVERDMRGHEHSSETMKQEVEQSAGSILPRSQNVLKDAFYL